MSIWRARPPMMLTEPTPFELSICLLKHFIGEFGQFGERGIAGNGERQNRRGVGIEGIDSWLIDVFRQARQNLVELVAHFLRGHIGIFFQVER